VRTSKGPVVCGLVAVGICAAIAGFWSVWGAIENFHEGWYEHSLLANLKLAFVQYLSWPILFALLATLGIWRPKLGGVAFIVIGVAINAFLFGFRNPVGLMLILSPCVILGLLFGFGEVPRPKIASAVVLGIPSLIIVAISIPLGWKVSHRITFISKEPLVWKAANETLVWAPPGPGWPRTGVSYSEAQYRCLHLSLDGLTVCRQPVNVWRLPTVDEAIEALNRGGKASGCTYMGPNRMQPCEIEPDKEAPVWDPFSNVIYWWTGSDDSVGRNMRICYNSYVLPVAKGPSNYTGFRAVKQYQNRARRSPN